MLSFLPFCLVACPLHELYGCPYTHGSRGDRALLHVLEGSCKVDRKRSLRPPQLRAYKVLRRNRPYFEAEGEAKWNGVSTFLFVGLAECLGFNAEDDDFETIDVEPNLPKEADNSKELAATGAARSTDAIIEKVPVRPVPVVSKLMSSATPKLKPSQAIVKATAASIGSSSNSSKPGTSTTAESSTSAERKKPSRWDSAVERKPGRQKRTSGSSSDEWQPSYKRKEKPEKKQEKTAKMKTGMPVAKPTEQHPVTTKASVKSFGNSSTKPPPVALVKPSGLCGYDTTGWGEDEEVALPGRVKEELGPSSSKQETPSRSPDYGTAKDSRDALALVPLGRS